MKKYCLGFAFDNSLSNVLLIEKQTPEWQKGLLNGVGGKLEDFDLSFKHAMTREFLEEVNINTTLDDWQYFAKMQGNNFEVEIFYSKLSDFSSLKQNTHEKPLFMGINQLFNKKFDNCINNLIWLVPMAMDASKTKIQSNINYNFNT